jgi:hypothetical protein
MSSRLAKSGMVRNRSRMPQAASGKPAIAMMRNVAHALTIDPGAFKGHSNQAKNRLNFEKTINAI